MNIEKLKNIKDKFEDLSAKISDPEVIADNKEWTKLVKEHSSLEPIVTQYDAYVKTQNDIEEDKVIIKDESDAEMLELAKADMEEKKVLLEKIENELKVLLLPVDPNDDKNVIIEIRGGAGGEEAALFAAEMMRMYKMYAEKNRWQVEDVDINMTELGGVKEAVFEIHGVGAYRKLKYESGVHRVQRVPDTETQGRIHTSTITVAVLPEVELILTNVISKSIRTAAAAQADSILTRRIAQCV